MIRIGNPDDIAGHYDVIVVGAGPAGMGAASTSSEAGLSVLVLDENAMPGGQIYRSVTDSRLGDRSILGDDYWKGDTIARRFEASACHYVPGAVAWHLSSNLALGLTLGDSARIISASQIVIATGAIERPFPIEGWTLPGVMTVGAAQIMLKTSAALPHGRVVLAGSGPLLWLYAWQAIRAGSSPSVIVDTTPRANLMAALPHLPGFLVSAYLTKGLQLLQAVRARIRVISAVTGVAITQQVDGLGVRIARGDSTETIGADHVLLHQGVVPNINLASAAGCEIVWNEEQAAWQPRIDAHGRSSIPGIWIVGDGAGIGGAEIAALRGEALGLALAAALDPSVQIDAKLKAYERGRPFLDTLYKPSRAFRLGSPAAIACRCEEITCGQVTETVRMLKVAGPNQLKAFLRTGMGPCQGRYCGSTVSELIAEARGAPMAEINHYRLRTPVKPITLGQMTTIPFEDEESKSVHRI
ncbi:FAD/NAD(P)-dependent oxidoreductase [Aliihoeflea sp. PC F10.4]